MKTQKDEKLERLNASIGFQYAREAMNRPFTSYPKDDDVQQIHDFVKNALRRNVLGTKSDKR